MIRSDEFISSPPRGDVAAPGQKGDTTKEKRGCCLIVP
jgi:hypothetical protein